MADKGGGPAYPQMVNGGICYWSDKEGVSVRDYFAALAMTAYANSTNYDQIAAKCYALADAMMVERAKP